MGKNWRFPVKRIFLGIELSKSVSREAMSNPDSLKPFLELAEEVQPGMKKLYSVSRRLSGGDGFSSVLVFGHSWASIPFMPMIACRD